MIQEHDHGCIAGAGRQFNGVRRCRVESCGPPAVEGKVVYRILQIFSGEPDRISRGVEEGDCLTGTARDPGGSGHRQKCAVVGQKPDLPVLSGKVGKEREIAKRMVFPLPRGAENGESVGGRHLSQGGSECFAQVVGLLFRFVFQTDLAENVIGSIPSYDELNPVGKKTVDMVGVSAAKPRTDKHEET